MNTFGEPSPYLRFPLYDPQLARDARVRFGRDRVPELDRANSIYIPTGRWPTRGWLLMARGDYNKLDRYSTELELEVGDSTQADNIGTLGHLSIVQAQCVTRGIGADANALYLVEVTDARGLACNEWFQYPLTKQYNIRSPAYPQTFHPASMNGGTTWTWVTMLQDMWEEMGSIGLGAWPGLPSGVTISGTPEGFWFNGVPAWTALCDVLDHLGLTVACDLTAGAAPYTIVRPGNADAAFTTLETRYGAFAAAKYRVEDDLEWVDVGAGRVPRTVVVLFKRRNSIYGTEETVYYGEDNVAKQWHSSPYYTVSVDAPAAFADAVGTHHIWSDFTVRYDDSSNPLDADIAIAQQIAQERVTQYFAKVYHQTLGRMSRTYTSALPFVTGSRVDGVGYYQDYRNSRQGWMTSLVRGVCPPWPGLFSQGGYGH